MTMNLAVVGNGNVYLFSDSAVMFHGSLPLPPMASTFGEPSLHGPKTVLPESALKIVRIRDGCFAACSGTFRHIRSFCQRLRAQPAREPITEALEPAAAAAADHDGSASIMVAVQGEKGGEIFQVTTNPVSVYKPRSGLIGFQGSLPDQDREKIVGFVRGLVPRGQVRPSHEVLQLTVIYLQTYFAHNSLLENGIGGAFYGLRIGRDGVHWMGDTYYSFYARNDDGQQKALHSATVLVREDSILLGTTRTAGRFNCLTDLSDEDFASFDRRWRDSVRPAMVDFDVPYLAFVDRKYERVAVMERSHAIDSNYIAIVPNEFGFSDLKIPEGLWTVLTRPKDDDAFVVLTNLSSPRLGESPNEGAEVSSEG